MRRRILVTGGAGYVGSIVVNELLGRGYSVRAFDALRYGSVASLLLPWGNPEFEFVRGDVRDSDARTHAVEDVEAIVHLAAIVGDPAQIMVQRRNVVMDPVAEMDLMPSCTTENAPSMMPRFGYTAMPAAK